LTCPCGGKFSFLKKTKIASANIERRIFVNVFVCLKCEELFIVDAIQGFQNNDRVYNEPS